MRPYSRPQLQNISRVSSLVASRMTFEHWLSSTAILCRRR